MKGLVGLLMQGRWQPVLFMGVTTLVPLLAWLGGAALALVTLRRGPLEGFVTMAAASLALGVGLAAMGANPVVSALGVLEYWGPVFLLACILRATVSLPLAMAASAAMAAVVLAGWHVLVADPVAFWKRSLGPLAQGENASAMMEALLPVMSGYWMLGLWSLVLGSLLLGRWWQALLYNPGGFRAEFHALRLDWRLGAAALAAMLGATFTGPGLAHDLSLLASGVFTIQALAVAHGLRVVTGWHWAVLIPVYGLLPFLFKLYALVGIADTWFDVRARWRSSNGSGG